MTTKEKNAAVDAALQKLETTLRNHRWPRQGSILDGEAELSRLMRSVTFSAANPEEQKYAADDAYWLAVEAIRFYAIHNTRE